MMKDIELSYYSYQGIAPVIDETAYIHPDATIIGEVIIGKNCFVGAQAVIRGDLGRILVEEGTNIQETCVIHSFPEENVSIGSNVHIGHGAILHGCTLEENVLIGMNAVIMDRAHIGKNSIIGALSFVKQRRVIAPNMLAFGNPVKEIRHLTADEIAWKSDGTKLYQGLARAKETTPCEPLRNPQEQQSRKKVLTYPIKGESKPR